MNEDKSLARRLVDHPRRRLFVITGTLLVAVVTILPAVDNYFHQQTRCSELSEEIAQMEQEVQSKASLLELAKSREEQLNQAEARLSSREDLFRLRGEMMALARQTGCSVRKEHLEDEQRRRWQKEDHLAVMPKPGKKNKREPSPYDLVTHTLRLEVVGPPENLQAMLAEIEKINKVKKTESLSLKVIGQDTGQAELGVIIQWFDLPLTTAKS